MKPKDFTMAQFALKWILKHDEVSCVIPGGGALDNTKTSKLTELTTPPMERVISTSFMVKLTKGLIVK